MPLIYRRSYGELVRKEDAEILREEEKRLQEIGTYDEDAYYLSTISFEIESKELP